MCRYVRDFSLSMLQRKEHLTHTTLVCLSSLDLLNTYPIRRYVVKAADEARARGNVLVLVRTTAITHTLVAPTLRSTRKSESPLVEKYGCQLTTFESKKRLTCEIGRFLKAIIRFGLLDELADEYSTELEEKKLPKDKKGLLALFKTHEDTVHLFDEADQGEAVGVTYEECCRGDMKKCKVLPFQHKLCNYVEYMSMGILDAEIEGNSVIPKPQFIEEILSLPNCDILEDQVKDDEDFRGSSGLFISPPVFQEDSEGVKQCGESEMGKFIDFFAKYVFFFSLLTRTFLIFSPTHTHTQIPVRLISLDSIDTHLKI